MDAVELSQSVMRWLDRADAEYRAMFHKKVVLLAQGNRTYALSKRLKHCCEVPIYETKLDAGQRILWTQLRRGDLQRHLLVSVHCISVDRPFVYLHSSFFADLVCVQA